MDYIAVIDSIECKNLSSFLKMVGIAFKFPDYYGENVNAFWDCIGDLSWLDAKNYSLVIENSRYFLIDENDGVKKEIIDLLDRVEKDWAGVPNYEGEDAFRQRANFKVTYLPDKYSI